MVGSNIPTGASRRSFLFLQGPIGLFFSRLAQRLSADGHVVHRINLHGGDRLFWRLSGAVDFRGDAVAWPTFFLSCLNQWRVTDLVLFGDCRPMHRAAISAAAAHGVAVNVFEEGYLRPNWVTLERGGVNGNSMLPSDPQSYREAALSTAPPEGAQPIAHNFARLAAETLLYHTTMVTARGYFPGYRTHRPWHPYVEYAHAAGRFVRKPFAKLRATYVARRYAARSRPFYLFGLQLDADTQIRHHSTFGRMRPAIEHVIGSFALHAPAEALLVVTEHPLDTGVVDLRQVARDCATDFGVGSRLVYLEGGTPPELLRLCRGMVTVNSTLGVRALGFGVPVAALGRALYALPGLSFQGGLDEFWRDAAPPDPVLFDAFLRVLIARTQINGGFHSGSGIALAVRNAASRLQEPAESSSMQPAPRQFGNEFAFAKTLSPLTH
jgi:capsular polysaccharide export protein